MKPKRILRAILTLAALVVVTAPAVESSAFAGGKLPQTTSKSSEVHAKKQAKREGSAQGKKKGEARQEETGRVRQGNHDSLTKPTKSGGSKGDRHDNGIRQAGAAGSSSGKKKSGK